MLCFARLIVLEMCRINENVTSISLPSRLIGATIQ